MWRESFNTQHSKRSHGSHGSQGNFCNMAVARLVDARSYVVPGKRLSFVDLKMMLW